VIKGSRLVSLTASSPFVSPYENLYASQFCGPPRPGTGIALPFSYTVMYDSSYAKIIRNIRVNYYCNLHKTFTALLQQYLHMRASIHSVPFLGGGGGGTESTITEATTGLLYQPRMMDDDDECGAVGGMSGKGNQSTRRKPAPSSALFPTNPRGPDPRSNPSRRSGKPATNCLSYGTAIHSVHRNVGSD
jgi:hypothetical protein